jgi:hypothetical protein
MIHLLVLLAGIAGGYLIMSAIRGWDEAGAVIEQAKKEFGE